ncbi:MAG: zinc-binding dehydrogenase [Acetobacteraceae bacterium]
MNCENQGFTGVQHDGGYAEVLTAKASGLISIPSDLSSVDATPLLCAGLTTFSGIRGTPAKAGDLVAVLGIGGLGHLAVQYARRMGFEVVAIGRGDDKAGLARKLGVHHYIDSKAGGLAETLQGLGGAMLVVSTASDGQTLAESVRGLAPRGMLLTLGVTADPLGTSAKDLVFGNKSIAGALTGDPATADLTLKFSAMAGVAPMIETLPLERAAEAYARMMAGDVRFRMVLTMGA